MTAAAEHKGHAVFTVKLTKKDGIEVYLGRLELTSPEYGQITEKDGLREALSRVETVGTTRFYDQEAWEVADQQSIRVTLESSNDLAAALSDEHTEPTSET